MKDALLYVSPFDSAASESALNYAAGFAQYFGTEMTALTFEFGVIPPVSLYAPKLDDNWTLEAQAKNRNLAMAAVMKAKDALNGAGARFIGVKESCLEVEAARLVVDYARLRDIAILPNGRDENALEREMAEDVLFESGRPLILVPQEGRTGFAVDRVMIAWDYSRTAVRAIADALPILARAKKIYVVNVTDDKDMAKRLGTVELARHLANHRIEIVIEEILRGSASISDALFGHAAAMNANLLVMGGYGRSRMRELILGGATRSALMSPPLPILMSH